MEYVPLPEDSKTDTKDLVTSIWQSGWKSGNKKGFDDGYKLGKDALNQWWCVIAIAISFLAGGYFGFAADWVHTCIPIHVEEKKSCVTRVGDNK